MHDMAIALLSRPGWKHTVRYGDALISRARSVVVSAWYRQTDDDVFLMVDDDISFKPEDAQLLVERCREGFNIISAAVPVRNGQHIAGRPSIGQSWNSATERPISMDYVGAAFVAVHRQVIDRMVKTMPLCHRDLPIAFWPMYQPFVECVNNEYIYLSEDWAFTSRARALGFKAWLEPTLRVGHTVEATLTVDNMAEYHQLFGDKWDSEA
jgi:hypothetical protein